MQLSTSSTWSPAGCLSGVCTPMPAPSWPPSDRVGSSSWDAAQYRLPSTCAGHGEVVHQAGFDIGYPQRKAVRFHDCLDVAAVLVGFPACATGQPVSLSRSWFSRHSDQWARSSRPGPHTPAVGLGLLQSFVQIGRMVGEHLDDLVEVPVPSRAGDPVIPRRRGDLNILAEPPQAQYRLAEPGRGQIRAGEVGLSVLGPSMRA